MPTLDNIHFSPATDAEKYEHSECSQLCNVILCENWLSIIDWFPFIVVHRFVQFVIGEKYWITPNNMRLSLSDLQE